MRDRWREVARGLARATRLDRVAEMARGIAGMPDYRGYVEHHRRCHPERPLLDQRQHFAEYLRARYADGPNRCC